MRMKPEENMKKCEATLSAVSELAPDTTFGGMKAEDYGKKVQAMRDARALITNLEAQLSAARDQRDAADALGLEAESLVVNGIIGDPNHGPDSPLYGATGRKRKSERKSGLTRKPKKETKP